MCEFLGLIFTTTTTTKDQNQQNVHLEKSLEKIKVTEREFNK
jgi:hypothetical protein